MVAVQEANRKYDTGIVPKMIMHEKFDRVLYKDIVDEIIGCKDRQTALNKIEEYNWFWDQFKSGSQGFSGKKTNNSTSYFDKFFVKEETIEETN